ncbi:MAG: hypothetical protein ACJ754_01630 [Pyrinomonadaceae bacterium]
MSDALDRIKARRERARRTLSAPDKPPKTQKAIALEALGYEPWAMRLGPRTFKHPFSPFHHRFWRWYWPTRMKLLAGERLTVDELTALLIWGRGCGKSSHVEWACIAEGALSEGATDEPGLVGYVCADSDLAKGHLDSIRGRLESSEVAHYYPGLANPRVSRGVQTAWRQDRLVTASGWGIIPLGLKEGVRGSRLADMRFSMLVFDDIDNRKYSPEVIRKNLDTIAYEILPAGNPQTLNLFPQNLVRDDGVLSQILSYETDVMSHRTVIGTEEGEPQPAFDEVELEPDEERPGVYKIASAVPVWEGFDRAAAEVFLSNSGRAAFLAEYQHDLTGDRSEYVLPNWRDEVHVITRSEFGARYGTREVPVSWGVHILHDWARTKSKYHANVASFLSVAAQNSRLPGLTILHEPMSFGPQTEADDVALRILKTLSPTVTHRGRTYTWDELLRMALTRDGVEQFFVSVTRQIEARRDVLSGVFPPAVDVVTKQRRVLSLRMSHEAKAARDVYRLIYGLNFQPANPGADGGLEHLNSLTRVDRTRPHLFKEDERGEDGTYRLGATSFFLLVEDHEAAPPPKGASSARLNDSALARRQLSKWRNVPEKVSETGAIERGPMKMDDDFGNMLMMRYHDGLPPAAPLNYEEKLEVVVPRLRELKDKLAAREPLTPAEQMSYWFARSEAKKRVPRSGVRRWDVYGQEMGLEDDD